MDSYKRPYRGTKIYVRKKDKNDNELVKLYKKSEFSEEAKEDIDDVKDRQEEMWQLLKKIMEELAVVR